MKNIVKKFDRVGMMVLLVAFFVAVGFKAAEKMENAPAWYEVEITPGTNPDLPENQNIIGEYPTEVPEGDCSLPASSEAPMCAAQLNGVLPNSFPITMKQAALDGAVTVDSKHLDED